MKPPVEPDEWPLAENLKWFADKSFKDLLENSESKFKQQLKQNVMKIVIRIVRLLHEKVDAWQYVKPHCQAFGPFLKSAMRLALSDSNDFDINMGDRYLPWTIWINLSDEKRELELSKLSKKNRSKWSKLAELDKKMDFTVLEERMFERRFIFNYLNQFLSFLENAVLDPEDNNMEEQENECSQQEQSPKLENQNVLYCQRFIEFIIDIESQLPLRRFFHAILNYTHLIVRCRQSKLAQHPSESGHLFSQLIELLFFYTKYEINIMDGNSLTEIEITRRHEAEILNLQKTLWSKFPHLREFATKPIKAIDNPLTLHKISTSFDSKMALFKFLKTLGLADEQCLNHKDRDNGSLMCSIFKEHYQRYESQMKKINSIPLFPNEYVIWDNNLVPDEYYNYEYPLALPKLNLQYLTMSDYLLRNFMLFKNESSYEIRQDLEEGISRSKCRWTDDGCFATGPKQRMALIIKSYSILDVGKPRLGERSPSKVRAEVIINMDYVKPEWRREWERLRKHDTCFLVSFEKPTTKSQLKWPSNSFPAKHGVKYVRGCEIEALIDSDGKVVDENLEKPNFKDSIRRFIVCMDCNQYQMDSNSQQVNEIYKKFHLMVRRKPEKNNFKGVLETIRNLINTKFVVPDWLEDLIIGYGEPDGAHHSNLRDTKDPLILDYFDTFLNFDHLRDSFKSIKPDYAILAQENQSGIEPSLSPPFRVRIEDENKVICVIPYELPLRGPYPTVMPKSNTIKFTPAQIEAISSGLQPGLTMIVGPPGTGKTDVAVQILSTLYHSHPDQRTLIVTHSNQALNQIFEKMIELDVKEHHLLRLGHGEEDLESDKDFSRRGRVKHVLARRIELLILVGKLARSLGLDPGQGLTCQSAEYFRSYHILSRWNDYVNLAEGTTNINDIGSKFPFKKFFDDAPQPIFKAVSISEDFEIAKGCFRYIEDIFDQLHAFRPFEIFSNASDRSQYLLIRESKIIAMTCTHAGLRRKELVELNFQYDNILMEETAQILEIETTIPLLLQNPENGKNRLKRWIMIGDHHQLPPIIQNSAFQKFSNMEQSLFARFIRLGVPAVELDAQGRARPSLCDLYRWRYKNLVELDHVKDREEYQRANAGFQYDYQLIDVSDYRGIGESSPMPFYYQNRGEAEYVIALYKYMRVLGYPGEKITILTTYNGQKQLIRDLAEQEFTHDAHIGMPSKITTVDKFQGQQNDYILLSLVRTKHIGHIRDIRRLVVAMSRARLGLYVFGRVSLFSNSMELKHSMKYFLARPQQLCLVTNEKVQTTDRPLEGHIDPAHMLVVKSVDEMQQLVAERYTSFIEEKTRFDRLNDEDNDSDEDGEITMSCGN